MCGIFGIISAEPEYQNAEMALGAIAHRGPDDTGTLFWHKEFGVAKGPQRPERSNVCLGHRRLSILDLSAAGHQPMTSPDGKASVVYNGEIYNYVEIRNTLRDVGYRFVSDSDTEVLLCAIRHWGIEAALRRFEGMFAFAYLDAVRGEIHLCRDAFGIKPLFFARSGNRLAFCSEIAPLLKYARSCELNAESVWLYLRFGITDFSHSTLLGDIEQVESGGIIKISIADNRLDITQSVHWSSTDIGRLNVDYGTAVRRVREQFLENVAKHLRSDVAVGTALSGGIDSSAIVCAIRHLFPNQEIHTFSYISSEKTQNEAAWIDIVNTHVGAIPHKATPTADDLKRSISKLMAVQGEPFGSTSIFAQYCVFQEAQRAGIKVMLDGQGADELLGGYPQYQGARLASMLSSFHVGRAAAFLRAQRRWPGRDWRDVFYNACGVMLPRWVRPCARVLVGKENVPNWVKTDWFKERRVELECPLYHYSSGDYLTQMLVESVGVGLKTLLRYEDRNSMAFSIESRVPFLTKGFVELALSLPENYLIGDDGCTKRVFRDAMRGIVPDAVLDRRDKIGFSTPEFVWLRGNVEFVERGVELARNIPFLRAEPVERYVRKAITSTKINFQAWRILSLAHWFERVRTGATARSISDRNGV